MQRVLSRGRVDVGCHELAKNRADQPVTQLALRNGTHSRAPAESV